MSLASLIPTLQLSIDSVILNSGIGLILLSMTNHFGRVIDRTRRLTHDFHGAADVNCARLFAKLRILSTRARLVRASLALAAVSILLSAILIICLFPGALLHLGIAAIILALFILCMLSLVFSLLLFISGINLSLRALWLGMAPEGCYNV